MSEPYYEDGTITLMHGDALECARTTPDASVQAIVTSPPYYAVRDYGEVGQYGAEGTLAEYVEAMVVLFRELRRALTDDGTLWLNLGDSYGTKNLLGVPWKVAFGLQDDGWILRSDNVWAKPNPMPSSVRDRTTSSHEYVFMFAKSPRYYFDAEAIAEPVTGSTIARLAQNVAAQDGSTRANGGAKTNGTMKAVGPKFASKKYAADGEASDERFRTKRGGGFEDGTGFANKRDVWTVATANFTEAHFAVYPPELIRPCILAGSRPGDIVLDPFSGSGTTGMVATHEARRYIGFDLNADYLDMSLRTRFAQPTLGIV